MHIVFLSFFYQSSLNVNECDDNTFPEIIMMYWANAITWWSNIANTEWIIHDFPSHVFKKDKK